MDNIQNFQVLWFILIFVLFAGYSLLDGFDLGVGTLLRFLGKNKEEKDTLIASIGPVSDGNEVWLVTAGGALFAAFPHAYATAFSGFYLAIMLVLLGLIFRAVSMEFRANDPKRAGLWEVSLGLGSLLTTLLFGVALGNIIYGVPLDAAMEYRGGFFTLLRPVPLLFGITGLMAVLLQGTTWTILKTEGVLRERAYRLTGFLLAVHGVVSIIYLLVLIMTFPQLVAHPLFYVALVVCVGGWIVLYGALRGKKDALPFWAASVAFIGLWLAAGAAQFPLLIRASNDAALSLTIYNSSTSLYALQVMSVIALVGMPIVGVYSIYVYRLFKGKARPFDHH